MKSLRFVFAVVLMLGLLILFAGCGENDVSDGDTEKDTETVLDTETERTADYVIIEEDDDEYKDPELVIYYDGQTKQAMSLIVDEFKKKHRNVNVIIKDYSDVMLPTYEKQIAEELASGGGPDIFIASSRDNNIFKNMTELIEDGNFLDVNTLDINFSRCNKNVMAGGVYKGGQYIVPLEYNLGFLYSTKERLDKYGIPYEEGTTLADFSDAIEQFYIKNPDKYAFLYFFNPNYLYLNNGIDWIDYAAKEFSENEGAFADYVTIADSWYDFYHDMWIKEDPMYYLFFMKLKEYDGSSHNAYFSGDLLFLGNISKRESFPALRSISYIYNEDVIKGETPVIFPMPSIDGTNEHSPVIGHYLTVNSKTENKEAVKMFIECAIDLDVQHLLTAYGLPVNDVITDYMKEFYMTKGPDRIGLYYFPKFTEFSKEFLERYFSAIDNMKPAVYADEESIAKLYSYQRLYPVVVENGDYETAFEDSKRELSEYLNRSDEE